MAESTMEILYGFGRKIMPSLMTCIIQMTYIVTKILKFYKKYSALNETLQNIQEIYNRTKSSVRISNEDYYLIYVFDEAFGVLIKLFWRHTIHRAFDWIQRNTLPSARE